MQHVRRKRTLRHSPRGIQAHEVAGPGVERGLRDRRVREAANEQAVLVVLDDVTRGGLGAADEADAAEDGGVRVGGVEGLLDVEAVLDEDEGCVGVVFGEGGGYEAGGGGWDVWDVFGCEDDVVVGWEVFFFEVRDCVADCDTVSYESARVRDGVA